MHASKPCLYVFPAAASPLGSEDFYLTNSREDTALARTAKLLAFPPALQAERLSALLHPLARSNTPSYLTSMALLEVVAAIAVGEKGQSADAQDGTSMAARLHRMVRLLLGDMAWFFCRRWCMHDGFQPTMYKPCCVAL